MITCLFFVAILVTHGTCQPVNSFGLIKSSHDNHFDDNGNINVKVNNKNNNYNCNINHDHSHDQFKSNGRYGFRDGFCKRMCDTQPEKGGVFCRCDLYPMLQIHIKKY